jgi:hypothetical protein
MMDNIKGQIMKTSSIERIVSVEIRQSMYNHGHAKQYINHSLLGAL